MLTLTSPFTSSAFKSHLRLPCAAADPFGEPPDHRAPTCLAACCFCFCCCMQMSDDLETIADMPQWRDLQDHVREINRT